MSAQELGAAVAAMVQGTVLRELGVLGAGMTKARHYAAARARLKTGDVVLFSGKGGISTSVKWVTLSRWSHVGMVMVLDEYDFVCVWESVATPTLADVESGHARRGVQLVPLSARVQQYEGEIVYRSLLGVELQASDVQRLMALRKRIGRRPYEKSRLAMMAAAWDGPFGHVPEDLSSLFCSELVAAAYQALGLIRNGRKDKPSSEYVPADFSEAREDLSWLRGALGPEIPLKE